MFEPIDVEFVKEYLDVEGVVSHLLEIAPPAQSTLVEGRQDYGVLEQVLLGVIDTALCEELIRQVSKR